MQLKQDELKTVIMLWSNYGSGVASYGALEHVPPSSFGNSVHSAYSSCCQLKMSKIINEKHVL